MKKSVKKAMVLGLTGITVFNSVPVNASYFNSNALVASEFIKSDFSEMNLVVGGYDTTLSMIKGKYYSNSELGKVLFSKDTVFELTVATSEDIGVTIDDVTLSYDGSNVYSLENLTSESKIVIGGVEVNLSDYMSSEDNQVEYIFTDDSSSLGDVEVSYDGLISENGYYNGNTIRFKIPFTLEDNLVFEDYDFYIKFNDKVISAEEYELRDNYIEVVLNLKDFLGDISNVEEIYKLEASLHDRVNTAKYISKELKLDTKAPSVLNHETKVYTGNDGLYYYETNNSGNIDLSFRVSDEGSGVKAVRVLDDGKLLNSLYEEGICRAELNNNVGLVTVEVEDNIGNIKSYSLSEILGISSNDLNFGIPNVLINTELKGVLSNVDGWFRGENIVLECNFDSTVGSIKYIKYYINGVEYVEYVGNESEYSLSLPFNEFGIKDGTNSVKIVAINNILGEYAIEETFNIDNEAPSSEGILVKSDDYNVFGNIAFLGDDVTIEGYPTDEYSGVDKVEVLLNGEVVSGFLPYTSSDSGSYSIRVRDIAGNSSEFALSELVGKDFDLVFVSKKNPSIDILDLPSDGVSIDGINWYKSLNKIDFTVESDNLKDIEVLLVNSNEETLVLDYIENDTNYSVNIKDLDVLSDGEYTLVINASTKAGKESSKSITFGVDSSDPSASIDKLEGNIVYGDTNFFKGEVKVNVLPVDEHSGISHIELINEDNVVIDSSTDNSLYFIESGQYSIKVYDKLGNFKSFLLGDLLGLDSNVFVADNKSPVISYSIPEGGVGTAENIYGHDIISTINTEDSSKICNFKVVCNGNTLYEGSNTEYVLDTTKVSKGENGIYDISITATDILGNIKSDSYIFYIDKEAPVVESGIISKDYVDFGGKLWFKGTPELSIVTKDNLVDVDHMLILNKDGSSRKSDIKSVELVDGDYAINVVDIFGNTSESILLKNLLGSEGSEVSVDSESPVINCVRPEGDLNSWFGKDVTYVASIEDNDSILYGKILVNNVVISEISRDSEGLRVAELMASTSEVDPVGYGTYNIEVIVSDISGNITTWEDTIYVDKEDPYFTNATIEDGDKKDYGVFYKENPIVEIKAKDDGIGLDNYSLVDDKGNVIETNTTGKFTLDTGSYSVVIKDKLGFNIVSSLKDLLGLPSNYIVVDGLRPEIECTRPEGSVNNWFAKDVEYTLNIKDSAGICYAEVYINDNLVDSFKAKNGGEVSKVLRADTSKVSANDDGSYEIRALVVDNAGNKSEWSDVVYIDRVAPKIDKFIILSEGYIEGKTINGSDKYGFYIKDSSDVEIHVSDGNISSGMDKVHYTLIYSNGTEEKGVVSIENGVAIVKLPKNFKGFISAYAIDKVGNKGKSDSPDGVISEDNNTHVNTSRIDISLPSTKIKDDKGYNLYNSDISLGLDIQNKTSGIRKIEWGIDDDTMDIVSVDNNGKVNGVIEDITEVEKNLVVGLTKNLKVSKNRNGVKVWVKVTDRVGNISETYRFVSIDKDIPVINVSYDSYKDSSYYNHNRVARVEIIERNFRSSDVVFSGDYGKVSKWENIGNDTWVANITFDKDGDYKWGINYSDKVGNEAKGYSSEKFTVDKVNPVLSVSFDNNDSRNGIYFSRGRIANISINERNFDESLVKLTGNGTIVGWNHNGDTHTANVVFTENGEYEFSLSMSDLSGNASNIFNSGSFIIDKDKPVILVNGVSNGVSYKKDLKFSVSVSDKYLDADKCSAVLVGRNNGSIKLNASFDSESGRFVFEGLPNELKYDDLYTLDLNISDKSGNVSTEKLSFSINRFGSQYKFENEHLLNNIINSAEDIQLVETSVDRLNIEESKVVIIRNGVIIDVAEGLISVLESGGVDDSWSYKYNLSKDIFTEDGKYQIQLYSKTLDGTDNSSLSQEYFFLLDTKAPEIIISGIEKGKFYNEVSKQVSIDIRDLSGISDIEANLNNKKVNLSNQDNIYYLTIDESSKYQKLEVTVVDMAGNKSNVVIDDFMISTGLIQVLFHSTWFRVVSGVVILASASLVGLMLARRKKNKTEELEKAKETAKLYDESSSQGSSSK